MTQVTASSADLQSASAVSSIKSYLSSIITSSDKDLKVVQFMDFIPRVVNPSRKWESIPPLDAPALDGYINNFDPSRLNEGKREKVIVDDFIYVNLVRIPPQDVKIKGGCVILHGSQGIKGTEINLAESLAANGVMSLIPSLFPHSVESTTEDQLILPLEQSVLSAYRGLNLLRSHEALEDPAMPIFLIGESRGGVVADMCGRSFYKNRLSPNDSFNKVVVVDGFQVRREETPEYVSIPMLYLHGESDEWTPLAFVDQHVQKLRSCGYSVELDVYKGANHGFLAAVPDEEERGKVQLFTDCTVVDCGEKGFKPVYYSLSDKKLIEGGLTSWEHYPNFFTENIKEKLVTLGSTKEQLSTFVPQAVERIKAFFDLAS
jgi:dienelactone hydrolase